MKIIILSILLILLIGCSTSEESNNTYRWTGNVTEDSSRFILSFDSNKFPSQINNVERWWYELQLCSGISVGLYGRPLIIEYVPREMLQISYDGWINWAVRYTRIIETDLYEGYFKGSLTKHEMLHYLLYLIEEPNESNTAHQSTLFGRCT